MTIDLSQFKQTFLEESDEGLDVLESGLLSLDSGTADDEVIHAVFRAAHSIKGGAGTFGLMEIADFTHIMETLLDEMRDGRREIRQNDINVLLKSVDVLREMLEAAADDIPPPMDRAIEVKKQLEAVLNEDSASAGEQGDESEQAAESASETGAGKDVSNGWKIFFHPMEHMLRTGNDTVRIIRELDELGAMELTVNTELLPDFEHFDPELSYLAWQIQLVGEIEKDQIVEIFEWVDEDCELTIEPLQAQTEISEAGVSQETTPQETTPQETTPQENTPNSALVTGEKPSDDVASADIQNKPTNQPSTEPSVDTKPADIERRKEKRKSSGEGGSIRVGTDKVDSLINMVGELVITQSMLSQMGDEFSMERLEALREGLAQLERNTRELQESVMRIRMLPISFSFQRFPRLVHDLSQKMDKKIELKMTGEQTELDKTVMEKIGDPLVHLVRNSLDHGIESPQERLAAGKPEVGLIQLNAYHQGGYIVIEISDDGAGLPKDKLLQKAIKLGLASEHETILDEKIYDFIFHPGFSTADQVSDISGRGVGMDVVRRNIKELSGNVEVSTEPGKGTTFTIRLPLTLAILDGQLVKVGKEIYIIPLVSIIESIEIEADKISPIAGGNEVYQLRDEYLPLIYLDRIFSMEASEIRSQESLMIVVEGDVGKVGIVVDDLLSQQQVVIKSLESNYKRVEGISGATILGDGTVALILDMAGLITLSNEVDEYRPKAVSL